MLIGLNLDLWTDPLVDKAISQFGKLIVWEEDQNCLATVLVKARVSGLDAIPWFFNFTEGPDPESDYWTCQCKILLTRLLGAQAQDEDFPPDDPDDIDPNNFEFFGFGQPGQGPPFQPAGPPNNFNGNAANFEAIGGLPGLLQKMAQIMTSISFRLFMGITFSSHSLSRIRPSKMMFHP